MKLKKLFAFLSAGVLCCCALGGTAFAEETEPVDLSQYQMGDINMDGVIDINDAQLALNVYKMMIAHADPVQEGMLTEEQLALGNVDGIESIINGKAAPVDRYDAYFILRYYTETLSHSISGITVDQFVAKKKEGWEDRRIVDPEQYELGDMTMDGKIDLDDAQLALEVYTCQLAHGDPVQKGLVTKLQLSLGNVDENVEKCYGTEMPVDLNDAQFILEYYTETLAGKATGVPIDAFAGIGKGVAKYLQKQRESA